MILRTVLVQPVVTALSPLAHDWVVFYSATQTLSGSFERMVVLFPDC